MVINNGAKNQPHYCSHTLNKQNKKYKKCQNNHYFSKKTKTMSLKTTNAMALPFNTATRRGRRHLLKYLYLNMPFELVVSILKLIIDSSPWAIHPISGELVEKQQLMISRVIFFKMFNQVDGATDDQYLLWEKNLPTDICDKFCRKCGEAKLALCFTFTPMNCLDPYRNQGCRHPHGNYRCHRQIAIMGGYCYVCLQDKNVPVHQVFYNSI